MQHDAGLTAFDQPLSLEENPKELGSGWYFGRRIDSFPQPFASRLPKSHPHTAAVVVDEFDPRRFKGVTNHDQGCPAGLI
jgi:hypothetical protein